MGTVWQPYFYLEKKDVVSPNKGKMIGFLTIFGFIILLFLKLIGAIRLPWKGLFIVLAFGIISIYIGKLIHDQKARRGIAAQPPGPKKPKNRDFY